MRITKLSIKNYKSFNDTAGPISFYDSHSLFVGKNNAGKSNIFSALNLLLGTKNPSYIKIEEADFFDTTKPIEIDLTIGGITSNDKNELFRLPNLTKQQKGALSSKNLDDIEINFSFQHYFQNGVEYLESEENEVSTETKQIQQFEIKLWGFNIHKKIEDVRFALIKMLKVPAVRNVSDELTGSKWTYYGQLMKSILEDSPKYDEVKTLLNQINAKIQEIFAAQKSHLLSGARVVSYVDDINFELTKEGKPSELLRNLEVFITEGSRKVNIQNTGTGTQSAVIIGILELALKNKTSKSRLFCVEEPEVFIHPHGIRYLGDLLRKISEGNKTQVVVSSHSPALVAAFDPQEIVRIDKAGGATKIFQPPSGALSNEHFKRFVNSENAEMFFSDKVLLIEGDTEKQLLPILGKLTLVNENNNNGCYCDFDKANIGIIKLDGKENLINFIKILEAFKIPYLALLDNDFLQSPQLKNICQKFEIKNSNNPQLVQELKNNHIIINTKGEMEDLIPDNDLATMTRKTVQDIQNIKATFQQKGGKTSDAFLGGRRRANGIFNKGKIAYAIDIANYYEQKNTNPIADLVRGFYKFDNSLIVF